MSATVTHLEPSDDLARFEQTAIDALGRIREHIETASCSDGKASGYAPMSDILGSLQIERWIAEGGMTQSSFDEFLQGYLQHSVHLHSPRYIGHQVSVPDYPGALAAMINGFTNNPMAIFEMGPAAASIEFAVTNWMLRKIGWTEQPLPIEGPTDQLHGAGVLTHGGSLANLTALLAARARLAPNAWREGTPPDLAVLTPASSHYSVARAVGIMGLGTDAIYHLPTNRWGVIIPEQLDVALNKAKADGKRVMALNANVCATATGLHDPLLPIAEFCREHNIWLHADGCHGATALLAANARHYLDGIELADSVVWDAHKMMQVPTLCAAVLLKDARDFDRAFSQNASYLAYGSDGEIDDVWHSLPRAVECTKAALGLKIFLMLAFRGESALGQFVDQRYRLTMQFCRQINAHPKFFCPYEPESNILCFRYGSADDPQHDALQDTIREHLLRQHEYHLTAATVSGRRYLRLTVMNRLTDAATISELLNRIEALVPQL